MATKDNFLCLNDKSSTKSNNSFAGHDTQQFSNLNLNQTSTYSNVSFVQSHSKSNGIADNKQFGSTVPQNNETTQKSFNKSTDFCSKGFNPLSLNGKIEEEDKKSTKNKNSLQTPLNSSTLSLHIAAYENNNSGEIVAANNSTRSSNGESKSVKSEQSLIKKWKNSKQTVAKNLIQNPFEFPRQQKENSSSSNPEVMQFKASQKLLNPNQSVASNFKMDDGWDFADPVDILPKLPENFQELIASKKWQERKEALEGLLTLATDNIKLDPKANYNEIVETLSKILAKDANINVAAVAAKCITQLAKGLRNKFGPHANSLTPVILEKFKEKKAQLRDPLIETIDAIYATTKIDDMCDELAAALGKPNPNIKIQTNQFLYRVFKTFNAQTAPKKVVKALTPLIAKCTGESDAEAREASFAALGAIMKAIGKVNAMTMLGEVGNDKTKMERIEKFYAQAVEEAKEEEAKRAAAQQASAPSQSAEASASEATTQSSSSSAPVTVKAAIAEPDPWDFADPVDILPKLPENFQELIASKKWQERKEALEGLLTLATDNIKLDPKANYGEIVETLSKILAKDANINVAAIAAKCITQIAKGLRAKFNPHVALITPVIFEKFKEKKVLLRDPLVEAIDAVYASTTIDAICEDVVAALGKPNPNIKIQTNLFLYRVFKTFNVQTAPKKVVKTLTPLIAKCTGESDPEAREASFSALGAIMKAIGKTNAMTMLGEVANDKTKMAQIEKFYNQAVEEAGVEVVSEMVQSMHKSADPAAAEKPPAPSGPKVVKPKGKPKPAEEQQTEDDEEPLRPMGKQDDDEKGVKARSASKNARRSVAPAAVPPSKSPEPVEPAGVLSSTSNRNARLKDEKNLKILKWNFKAPTEEHTNQLLDQFTAVGKPDFVKMLFSKDFKLHLKALDQMSNQLQLDPLGIINNCDLILKWATFRFFDTNPQSLNRTLEVCLAMLMEMESQNAKLNDTDVTSFVPYLLTKSGDTKDIVRNLVRKIVSQVSICHVPAKIFPLILDALNTKNSRQKAECLQLADTFLEYFGLNISANPQQSLKTIAGCISERDSNARNAALNCIGTVWRKVGDRIYQMIGNIPPKEKAMLDERIKRMGREPAQVNDEPTIRLTPKSLMNNTQTIAMSEDITETPRAAIRSRSTSRQAGGRRSGVGTGGSSAGAGLNTTFTSESNRIDNEDVTVGEAVIRRPTAPPKSRFSLSSQHYDPLPTFKYTPFPTIDFGLRKIDLAPEVQQQLSSTSRPSSTVMPKRSESIASITSTEAGLDQVERTVSALSSVVISTVIEATNQLVYVFRDQNTNSIFLIEKADLIAKTAATQLSIVRTQHLVDRESDNETNDLMRSLCNFLTFFMHQKQAVSQISHTTIKLLTSELLRFICDERASHLPDHSHIVRSVNVITVKLCDHSDINECFCANLHLLDSYISTEAPQKLVELLLKCIFKHTELFLQPNHAPLQIDRLLTELDQFLNKYYTKQATGLMKRVIDSLKLVIQRIATITFHELDPYLTLIKRDGFLYSYLGNCMTKLQEKAQTDENVPPKKKNEKTLEEMFAQIQDTIATGGLTELFFYLEAHPEEQAEFDRLLELCPIPAMVQYCFDEFKACRDAKNPKSFHQIYAELAGAAAVPMNSARSGGGGQKMNGLEKLDVSLPFSMGSPISSSNATTTSSASNGRLQSTPQHTSNNIRPASPKFSPIPSSEITNYKKRLSSLRLNQH